MGISSKTSHHHRPDRPGPKPFKGKSKGKLKKQQKGRVDDGAAISTVLGIGGEAISKSRLKVSKRANLPETCPRLVALLPCHPEVDLRSARNQLLVAAGAHPDQLQITTPVTVNGFTFAEASPDLFSFLDLAKVADIIVPVVCPRSGSDSSAGFGVDERSEHFLSTIKAQGLASCLILTQGLDMRSSPTTKKTCTRYLYTLLPDKPRIVPSEKGLEAIRYLKGLALRTIGWRDARPYMLGERVEAMPAPNGSGTATVAVSGFVRGPNQIWSPDRLVHVTGFGDFQLERIVTDDGDQYESDPMQRQSLDGLCELDPFANEQSLITDQELQECDEEAHLKRQAERKERLMIDSGLSEIQATWESAIISDDDDDDDEAMCLEGSESRPFDTEGADHISMALKFRMERDELEFPDEVDCPVDQEAKVRFQKYRGLQNFINSHWDPMEELPLDYGRIFRFENYAAARKRALLQSKQGSGAASGTYCRLVLIGVPMEVAQEWVQKHPFMILSSLHQYERQVSISHYKIRRSTSMMEPISSKSPLLIASGFRRFPARPLFSQDTPNCDKHRVERFLQPNRYTIASCYSRIDFSHASTLVFKGDELIASGSHIGVDPNRLLIKRIVLAGYPIRVHKRRAVVRYMFFRPSDVRWFKPVVLTTKSGHVGQIDEPLGTHGYMKCSFNGMVKYNDTICMNLYKRQFPPFSLDQFQSSL